MHRSLQRWIGAIGGVLLTWPGGLAARADESPLATLEYRVLGVQLQVTPAAVSVPKNIPGSVRVSIADASGNTNVAPELAEGAYVEAIFRGPSFPARKLVAKPNEALMLPALNLVGDYQLDGIRLVDAATGEVRLEGTPKSVPVRVFDEVLVSRVTSRPLSLDEIQERGIVIDQQNFRVVEFEVGFVLDGKQVPVKFPVVAPVFEGKTDIVPQAEIRARLVEAQQINDQIASDAREQGTLPPELTAPRLNIQIKGVNFQKADDEEGEGLGLGIPPIPALMVIPGNIGYLNQFFSVQIFTENGAPVGSGLSVHQVQARLALPPGPDLIVSTNYSQPGDDPLRFARVGANAEIKDTLSIIGPPPVNATRFNPGEGGSAEFLVEGLQEGLHVMDLDLTAELDGLAARTVRITGKAAGSVLVRNPKFSLAFTHPKTVSFGEIYTASVTLLNTGDTEANLVNVTLRQGSLSGGKLEGPETVQLGNLKPGESATASYRVRAQRTGRVKFSNLTTSENSVLGRFNLVMGVDERGVELSPDSLVMPDYADELPGSVVDAARRVLGQGLSIATAGRLPAGVKPVGRGVLINRVLELAEAGQRVRYGEPLGRVLPDLALDWQAARSLDAGFDQIIRETGAGREWREALAAALEAADPADAVVRLAGRAADLAGRGEAWVMMSSSVSGLEPEIAGSDFSVQLDRSGLERSAGYRGTNGHWLAAMTTNGVARWTAPTGVASAELALLTLTTNGTGQLLRWTVPGVPPGGCVSYDLAQGGRTLVIDADCDGTGEGVATATVAAVAELPPALLTVFQETQVQFLRPWPSCFAGESRNYGNLLAVLFSKPMTQTNLNIPSAYTLDSGTPGASVQIQQGNRVALVAMRESSSAIIPRSLTVDGVTDQRGNRVVPTPHPIQSAFKDGVAARGRVLRADGSPAVGVPVTLTLYDLRQAPFTCVPVTTTLAQKFTDAQGFFDFDLIFGAVPFTLAAVDTAGVPFDLVTNILGSFDADQFQPERFLASLVSSNLAGMGNRTAAEAVALAEGLDRAVWYDQIDLNGGRAGGTNIIGLRFRGRGTVTGRVLAEDGATAVAGAAVNLYPDSASREMGRGIFTDDQGRFRFNGVPLGNFTVTTKTSRGHYRTVVDVLDEPFQVKEIEVVLTAPTVEEIVRTGVQGRVVEADGVTPVPDARVYVNGYNGGAVVTADEAGYWSAEDLPVGPYDLTAVSRDQQRGGSAKVEARQGQTVFGTITLRGVGRVTGRVETASGLPVADAVVSGGRTLVRTDANGLFVLEDIPQGPRNISAGWEEDKAPGGFPRLGSASVNVLPGVDNFVVVRFRPAGQIIGQVRNSKGAVVPNIKVAIPVDGGFVWVDANEEGVFKFINMGVGTDYTISAPSPPVDQDEARDFLGKAGVELGPSEADAQILATVAAVLAYNKRLEPGSEPPPAPADGFGWTQARLSFDGETVVANVSLLPYGTASGVVENDQGVRIGARVRLTGVTRSAKGEPKFGIVGNMNSDPGTGAFRLGGLLVGDWGLQAASPFYPVVPVLSGRTTKEALDLTNVVLRFPPVSEVNGRLTGRVLQPDGSPAGENVNVQISFGPDYIIRTDTNGFFDTQIKLPAAGYRVEARDPASGLRGEAQADVKAGLTNYVEVRMLGLGSARVTVLDALGAPAPGVSLSLEKPYYPSGTKFDGFTDAGGGFAVDDTFEGVYSVYAALNAGTTKLEARGAVLVAVGETNSVTLRLGGTGTLRGVFLARDSREPIAFARVNIGSLASVPTDAEGRFEISGLGLGTYRLLATDAVTGRSGLGYATVSFAAQVVPVTLTELAQGEVSGQVFKAGMAAPVAGARVSLSELNGINPPRTVTTGPDGAFRFPGVLPGEFSLSAATPESKGTATAAGTFPDVPANVSVNLTLSADEVLGSIEARVFESDGLTAATNAQVSILGLAGNVDFSGRAVLAGVPLGSYTVEARGSASDRTSSYASTNVVLSEVQTNVSVTLRLSGVGAVQGRVFQSDGLTPAVASEVLYQARSSNSRVSVDGVVLTDGAGRFAVGNLPVGRYTISARFVSLAAREAGEIVLGGQTNEVTMILGPSGSITGQVVRANGQTPVAEGEVTLTFAAPSGLDGLLVDKTDADGGFRFDSVPVGLSRVQCALAAYNGLVFTNVSLVSNGQVLNAGTLRLDEDWPRVIAVTPEPDASGVTINTVVDLAFSEPIKAGSFDAGGVYLSGPSNTVAATVQLRNDTAGQPTIIRLTPNAPLRSQTTYRVIAVDNDRKDALGSIVGRGPLDLVDRPLLTPFYSGFTTRDDDPPILVSLFPTNGQVQVDPRAVLRLSFNEPIRSSNFTFTVTGPGGAVAGSANVGLNGLVLVFTPSNALPANSRLTISVSGVADLAGNPLAAQPVASVFDTLDTRGPELTGLRLAEGAPPVAGSAVQLEALVAGSEPGVTVQFSADLNPLGLAAAPPFRRPVTLPASGFVIYRAVATDAYGNDGPFRELRVDVVPNTAPVVTLTALGPATNGVVGSGQTLQLLLTASDDVAVTNVSLVSTGALTSARTFTNAVATNLTFIVPAGAQAGSRVGFGAQAVDGLGVTSAEARLQFTVQDRTTPSLAIVSPTNGTVLDPREAVTVQLQASDNSTGVVVRAELSGAVTSSREVDVALVAGSTQVAPLVLAMPSAPLNGGQVTLRLTATDGGSNVATLSRTWSLADVQAPQLVSVTPTNAAPLQSIFLDSVRYRFNDSLDAASVTTNRVRLLGPGGVALPLSFRFQGGTGGLQDLLVTPSLPLQPGTSYTNILGPELSDAAGNRWTDTNGVAPPPGGLTNVFTTARFLSVEPAPGAPVLGGTNFQARVTYEAGIGAGVFRFTLGGRTPVVVGVGGSSTSAVANLPVELDAAPGSLTLKIEADNDGNWAHPYLVTNQVLAFGGNATTNQRPVLALTRVAPVAGPLAAGMNFVLRLGATDDFAVTNLTLNGSGALVTNAVFGNGAVRDFALKMPPGAGGGTQTFTAWAVDDVGATSLVATLTLPILPAVDAIATNEIVYSRSGQPDGAVYVAAADGSNERQITVGEHPRLSPDGRYVAFKRDGALYNGTTYSYLASIYVRDLQSGDEGRVFVNSGGFIGSYGWRTDGSKLVYSYGSSIRAVAPDGSGLEVLYNGPTVSDDAPSVNPVDGRLVFGSGAGGPGLMVSGPLPAAPNIVRVPGSKAGQQSPVWSPDGEWIAFLDSTDNGNLWKVRPDGSGLLRLTSLTGANGLRGAGAWVSGGAQMVVPANVNGTNGLYTVNTDGTGIVLLRANAGGSDYDFVGSIRMGYEPGDAGRLAGSVPAGGAVRVGLWPATNRVEFTRSVQEAGVPGNVEFTNNAGMAVPYTVRADGTRIWVDAELPLEPGVTYTNRVLPGLRDRAGQAFLAESGQPIPPQGVAYAFTTADILSVSPASGSLFEAGTFITATVNFESGLGADFFRFVVGNGVPVDVAVGAGDTEAGAELALPFTGAEATLQITAYKAGQTPYGLPPITLNLTPPGGAPIQFLVAGAVELVEGTVSNVVFQVNSSAGPLDFVDFDPGVQTPAFAGLSNVVFNVVDTNGVAQGVLTLQPGAADAGSYLVGLRARTAGGLLFTTNIAVTVFNDPGLNVTSWKAPISGNWSVAANWTAGVPDATLAAVIDLPGDYTVTVNNQQTVGSITLGAPSGTQTLALTAGTLTINGLAQVRSNAVFVLSGGTLAGAGEARIRGRADWIAGTLSGPGRTVVSPGATLRILSDNTHFFYGLLENQGTIEWPDGGTWYFASAELRNRPGAAFNWSGPGVFSYGGGTAAVLNEGLVRKTGTTTNTLGIYLDNRQTVELQSGQVVFSGQGISSNSIVVASGASAVFSAPWTFAADSSLVSSDSGSVRFTAGTMTVNTPLQLAGRVPIQNCTVNLNTDQTFSEVALSGTLGGSGTVTVTNVFDWTSGTLAAGGALVIAPGATLRVLSDNTHYFYRLLENHGTIEWPDGGTWYFASAELRNRPGAAFNWSGSGVFSYGGGTAAVLNEGLFRKTGATTNTLGIYLDNRQTVELQSGQVVFSGQGISSNSIVVASGASAVFSAPWTFAADSSLVSSDSGSVRFTAGTMTVNAPLQLAGRVPIQNCTVNLNTDQTFSEVALSGTLGGSGTVTVTHLFDWTSGTLAAGGALVIAPGATLRVLSDNTHYFYRLLENHGTIEWPDGGTWYFASAELRNRSGAVFNWSGSGVFSYGGGTAGLLNQGLLQKTGVTTNTLGIYLDNQGGLEVGGGRLELSGGGILSGTTTVAAAAELRFASGFTYEPTGSLTSAGSVSFSYGTHQVQGVFDPQGALRVLGGSVTIGNALNLTSPLVLDGGTMAFDTDQTLGALTIQPGATLSGSGVVTVGALTWNGGTMSGTGRTVVPEAGTAALNTSSTRYLYRTLENHGTVDWSGPGDLYLNGALWNAPTGTLLQQEAGTLRYAGGNAVVTNAGLWNKTFVGTNEISVPFVNEAPLVLTNGVLRLTWGGMIDAPLDIQSPAELRLEAAYTHTTNSALGGTGTIRFTGGTHDLLGAFDPQGPVWFDGGNVTIKDPILPDGFLAVTNNATVNFKTNQSFAVIRQHGTLGGSADVTVANEFLWLGGTISGTGVLHVPAGATAWVTNANALVRYQYRPLELGGRLVLANGEDLYLGAPLWSQLGGQIEWTGNSAIRYAGGTSALTNDGQIYRYGSGTNEIYAPWTHRGALVLDGGGLKSSWGGELSGSFTVPAGSVLLFSDGNHVFTNGVSFAGSGTVRFQSQLTHNAPMHLGALQAWFESGIRITGSNLLSCGPGGSLNFSRTLTFPGSITVGGNMTLGASDLTVTISGTLTLQNGATLVNPGTLRVKALIDQGGTIVGNAPILSGASPAGFSIRSIELAPSPGLRTLQPQAFSTPGIPRLVSVVWEGDARTAYAVEASSDLVTWTIVESEITELAPGVLRARFPEAHGDRRFYRVRGTAPGVAGYPETFEPRQRDRAPSPRTRQLR